MNSTRNIHSVPLLNLGNAKSIWKVALFPRDIKLDWRRKSSLERLVITKHTHRDDW